jgi:hypothetical protein
MSSKEIQKQQQLPITNVNALKSKRTLISTAKVKGGGVQTSPLKTSSNSLTNPLKSSKEILTVNDLFPAGLRQEIQTLVSLLEKYYLSENTTDLSGVSALINTISEKRNIDAIDIDDEETIIKWFYEYGRSFFAANDLKLDKRIFLKYIGTFLRQKGSFDAIRSFFRVLYNKTPRIYVPWEDVLITSDGKWKGENQQRISLDGAQSELKGFVLSKGEFKTNDGFLSDNIYLQDSYYYQQYSYDVGIDIQGADWEKPFKELLHPAGFILFTTLLLIIESTTSGKMPVEQFGKINNLIRTLKILIIGNIVAATIKTDVWTLLKIGIDISTQKYHGKTLSTRFWFNTSAAINDYGQTSIAELILGDFNANSYIKQEEVGSPIV